jgi:hypothetical protein
MNVVLWMIQGLVAAMFLMSGVTKSTQPRDKLVQRMPFYEDIAPPVVRLIGGAELAGALGLVLPAVFGFATVLAPLAATGLALIMVLATGMHARRKEPGAMLLTSVLLILAVVIAWSRFRTYSF